MISLPNWVSQMLVKDLVSLPHQEVTVLQGNLYT